MYRTIDTKFWTDPKVRRLAPTEKYLFLYFLTCPHSHVSGMFYLPTVLIEHETALSQDEVEYGIDTLSKAYLIRFDTTNEVVWVRHMLRYQPKGDKIRQAVASQLQNLHNCSLIREFLEEYADIGIPYQYPIDRASTQEQEQEQIQEQDLEGVGGESPTRAPEYEAVSARVNGANPYQAPPDFMPTPEMWELAKRDAPRVDLDLSTKHFKSLVMRKPVLDWQQRWYQYILEQEQKVRASPGAGRNYVEDRRERAQQGKQQFKELARGRAQGHRPVLGRDDEVIDGVDFHRVDD